MIDMAEAQPDLWKAIFHDDAIKHCFTCGRCVAGCPASEAEPPLLVRTLVRKVLFGLEDSLLDDDTPWTCVSCTRCEEACPMGVRPFEVGLAIRRWQNSEDETRFPMAIVDIYKRGYTQAVGNVEEKREALGLEPKPPIITEDPELHQQFKDMLMSVQIISDQDYLFGGE